MGESDAVTLCSRCAREGRTCCQDRRVFLTRGDVERVRRATGRDDFYETARASEEEYASALELDPEWGRIFACDGRRRVLRHAAGSADCCFLTPSGCSLSLDVRPLVCRLYPFDYTATTIKGVHGHLCPLPERDSPPFLLALLAMNRSEAESWRELLYREIGEEFPLLPPIPPAAP